MSKIAFGTYRLSIDNPEHYNALKLALEKGCNVIDSSSNYMDGKSEQLVGKVLKENPLYSPTIVTKGGFFTLEDKEELEKKLGKDENIFKIKKGLFYSLGEKALEFQIEKSFNRLNKNSLEIFLIHNPESYFLKEFVDREMVYKKILDVIKFLEKMVELKKIKYYGMSSKSFSLSPQHPNFLDLEKIINMAIKINPKNNFKWIEFPLNLMERGPLERYDGLDSLIEKAKKYGLTTLIDRPLNAYQSGHLTRLATYEKFSQPVRYEDSINKLEECIHWMENIAVDSNEEIPQEAYWIFTNLRAHWVNLHSVDQVENIFSKTIRPFILNFGGEKFSKDTPKVFQELLNLGLRHARQYMTKQANQFRIEAVRKGILPNNPEKDLAVLACETYSKWNVDYIALGMKRVQYVNQLCHFF